MPQATPLYRNIDFAENLSLVKTEREFHALIDKLYSEDKLIGFDIETGYSGADTPGGALNTFSDTQFITGFSITNSPNWARYIPLRHDFGDNLDPNVVWSLMKPLLEEKPTVAHNCFTGDTEAVIRNEGSVRLDSLVGQRKEVLTEEGWRWADFRSYGKSEVRKIVLAPSHSSRTALTHTVYATPNHRWYLQDGRVVTTDELHPYIRWAPGVRATQGTHVKANPLPAEYDEDGFRHGLIFADGSLNTKQPKEVGVWSHQIRLCGHKAKYSHLFDVTYPPSANGDPVANRYKSTVNCKELPPQDASDAYVASFIQGWMALDGHRPKPNK